jgi:hypothetical protein
LVRAISFSLAPSSEIKRLASLPELARPVFIRSCTIEMPSPTSLLESLSVGSSSPVPPFSKTSRDVDSAVFAAASPCRSVVASFARMILASFISDPSSAPRRSHSSIGSSV